MLQITELFLFDPMFQFFSKIELCMFFFSLYRIQYKVLCRSAGVNAAAQWLHTFSGKKEEISLTLILPICGQTARPRWKKEEEDSNQGRRSRREISIKDESRAKRDQTYKTCDKKAAQKLWNIYIFSALIHRNSAFTVTSRLPFSIEETNNNPSRRKWTLKIVPFRGIAVCRQLSSMPLLCQDTEKKQQKKNKYNV